MIKFIIFWLFVFLIIIALKPNNERKEANDRANAYWNSSEGIEERKMWDELKRKNSQYWGINYLENDYEN